MAIYSGALWRGPVPNQGGQMSSWRLGVVHIMEGTLPGTDNWFHNASAQVSAHFGVGKQGTVYQWVDTGTVAWAEQDYNDVAISVECEGNSGDSLTPAQLTALSGIIGWAEQVYGLPPTRNSDPAGSGWIGHGELGVAGGNHPDCPGDPVLAQVTALLAPAPPPPPTPTEDDIMDIKRATIGDVDLAIQINGAGGVYAKVRSGAQPWGAASNVLLGSATVGSQVSVVAAGTQFQVMYEDQASTRVMFKAASVPPQPDGTLAWGQQLVP
jgi:hypothetical protein